ncbi:hypothetical protein BKA66DRAFT_436862 [Pyrenochaeta sp. MPI-SDFR-AT-0127]|nr:hypothetical protein BKA66DRAFT_436862 [Pyrenochaeta sp. MPI-SDFR-AT-0127]
MSHSTAAVKLLVLSLPFVLSLPQALPPFQLFNITETPSSPTGVPEPAPILDPGIENGTVPNVTILPALPIPIEPGIGDNTGPEIFIDPFLPVDPIPFPLPTVTVPLDPILSDPIPLLPEAPPVSINTIVSVLQPLLDVINDVLNSLLKDVPLVRPLDSAEGTDVPIKRRDALGEDLPQDTVALLTTLRGLISTAISLIADGSGSVAGVPFNNGLGVADLSSVLEAAQTIISTVDIPSTEPVATPLRLLRSRQWWGLGSNWNPIKPPTPTVNPWWPLGGNWGIPKPVTKPTEPATDGGLTAPPLDTTSSLELLKELIDLSVQLLNLGITPTPLVKRDGAGVPGFGGVPVVSDLVKLINQLISLTFKINGVPFKRALGKRDALPKVSSDAIFKFYSSLASNQDPIDTLGPFAATLKESFNALDDATQAAVLRVLAPEPEHFELTKREGRVGDGFISHYIEEFHYLYPILTELAPDIAEGLEDVISDPSRPLPSPESLDLDKLPGQLSQFVLDTYVFWEIIGDAVLPHEDKLQILLKLFEGLSTEKQQIITKRESTPLVSTENIGDSPTWDGDRVGYVVSLFWDLDPAMRSVATESDAQLFAPWNEGYSNVDVDLDSFLSNFEDEDKQAAWKYIEFVELLNTLSKPEQGKVQEILQSSQAFLTRSKRDMRHKLRNRQEDLWVDEGAALDDAPKLGAELDAVLGESGTLDPLNQQGQTEDVEPEDGNTPPDEFFADSVDPDTPLNSEPEPLVLDFPDPILPVPVSDIVGGPEAEILQTPPVESLSGPLPADLNAITPGSGPAIDVSSLNEAEAAAVDDINVGFLPEFDIPNLQGWAEFGPDYIKAILEGDYESELDTADTTDDTFTFDVRPSGNRFADAITLTPAEMNQVIAQGELTTSESDLERTV